MQIEIPYSLAAHRETRRASFGTLCPPCGMIYRAIRLPYLWYWPSFVQPVLISSPFSTYFVHIFHAQTWDLSKTLHCQIFRPKILHHHLRLISTILVIKTQKNEWKWRNLHFWQKWEWQISSLSKYGLAWSDKFTTCIPHRCMAGLRKCSLVTLLVLLTWLPSYAFIISFLHNAIQK